MGRNLNVYSDKMHRVIRLIAKSDVKNIAEVGMITKISKNTVDKLIIKDKNGIHDTLDSVDMASVEYVAFDIKNVGIFGYIMPADKPQSFPLESISQEENCLTIGGSQLIWTKD